MSLLTSRLLALLFVLRGVHGSTTSCDATDGQALLQTHKQIEEDTQTSLDAADQLSLENVGLHEVTFAKTFEELAQEDTELREAKKTFEEHVLGERSEHNSEHVGITSLPKRLKVLAREWEFFHKLNHLRAEGFTCPGGFVFAPNNRPLLFDCRLWRAAYLHSQDQADKGYAGHISQDGRAPVDRAWEQGVPPHEHRNAENLGFGQAEPGEVLEGWKGSSAHCRTMMHPELRMLGVGYVNNGNKGWRHYWTLMLSWSSDPECLDGSCYPNAAPAPTPASGPGCDVPLAAPSNFGFITGPWTGDCKTQKHQQRCAFQHLAKTQDGDFIAGQKAGMHYYRMVKFSKDGKQICNSGRYNHAHEAPVPSDASDLVRQYATGKVVYANYKFSKGEGFICTAGGVTTPTPAPPLSPTLAPTTTPTPAPQAAGCDVNFKAPPEFGFITGPWTGSCRHKKCAFQNLAKTQDGDYIAGFKNGQWYKMVKFDKDGQNVANSARYYGGSAPSDASDLVRKYGTATSAHSNYKFSKGNGFVCTAGGSPTAPTPAPQAAGCDVNFKAPPEFGFITGPWTGSCRHKKCAFQNLAKTQDGDYIAGFKNGQWYQMVKFDKDGQNVGNSARYYGGSAPSDASDLVRKYGTATSAHSNYKFSKGGGFVCSAD